MTIKVIQNFEGGIPGQVVPGGVTSYGTYTATRHSGSVGARCGQGVESDGVEADYNEPTTIAGGWFMYDATMLRTGGLDVYFYNGSQFLSATAWVYGADASAGAANTARLAVYSSLGETSTAFDPVPHRNEWLRMELVANTGTATLYGSSGNVIAVTVGAPISASTQTVVDIYTLGGGSGYVYGDDFYVVAPTVDPIYSRARFL